MKKHGYNWQGYVSRFKENKKVENHQEKPKIKTCQRGIDKIYEDTVAGQKGIIDIYEGSGTSQEGEEGLEIVTEVLHQQQLDKVQDFDEELFKEKLSNMKNSLSSIENIVRECIENVKEKGKADYKIIRCLGKSIKIVKEKLTIFYIIHQLALKSTSPQYFQFNERLGQFIVGLIPEIKDFVPHTKIKKCIIIWVKSLVFKKETLVRLLKYVKELDCHKALDVINISQKEAANSDTVRPKLSERLLRDFDIDVGGDSTP